MNRAPKSTASGLFASLDILSDILRFTDVMALVCAAYCMYWIRFQTFGMPNIFVMCVICTALPFTIISQSIALYDTQRISRFFPQLIPLSASLGLTLLCVLAFLFFVHSGDLFSRIWIGGWFVLGYLAMLCVRLALVYYVAQLLDKQLLTHNIVLVDTGTEYAQLVSQFQQNNPTLRIVGIFLVPPHNLHNQVTPPLPTGDIPFIPSLEALLQYCQTHMIDDVIMTSKLEHHPLNLQLLKALEVLACNIKYCIPSDFFYKRISSVELLSNVPVVTILKTPLQRRSLLLKRIADIVLASLALIILSPLLLLVALCIVIEDGLPILFVQQRKGFVGKVFNIYKFRSMKEHPKKEGIVVQAKKGDERLTRIGHIIRRSSIDELPQLLNVMKGEMSIVGPRPHAIEHNNHYAEFINSYAARHRIKPGITGWAQVNGWRGETDTLEKMHMRVQHDLHYIENWTVWLDLKILLLTIPAFFTLKNAY